MAPIVEFERAGFGYPARPHVVADLSLTIGGGEVLVLVGRSGAGKSTVLKLVNGLRLPTVGAVRVEGRDTREWDGIALRRRVGYVIQDVGLFPHMTVHDNVGVVPRLEGWPEARTRERVVELLALVGLPDATYGTRLPRELSGGERQRVGLARAIAIDPPILLMDEPFGALDPVTRLEVRVEFMRIRAELGITAIVVTHDMAEALALDGRIGVLDDGRLIACDRPDAIAVSADARVQRLLATALVPPRASRAHGGGTSAAQTIP